MYRAYQKYIRISPRKLRLVADSIRKMPPKEALMALKFIGKRAAKSIFKVLKQALANAKMKGIKEEDLEFMKLEIGEGPTLKRWRAVSRGRGHRIMKRTSHIKIILKSKEQMSKIQSKKKKSLIKRVKSSNF